LRRGENAPEKGDDQNQCYDPGKPAKKSCGLDGHTIPPKHIHYYQAVSGDLAGIHSSCQRTAMPISFQ
jgi:hypothetical protein